MARDIFTQELIKEIIEMHTGSEKLTCEAIGQKINKHPASVRRQLRKNNALIKQITLLSDEEKKYILHEYNIKKVSSEVIGKALGRNGTTICRFLEKNNFDRRPPEVNKRKYQIVEDFFSKIETEEQAYFLGLLYADGSVHSESNDIKLTVHPKDKILVEYFSKIIYGFNKTYMEKRIDEDGVEREYISVAFYCKKMKEDLIKLGCTPRKTFTITFPTFLENELIPHFIRGFFDGDGCFSLTKDKLCVMDITSNTTFINQIKKVLMDKFNINTNLYIRENNPDTACIQTKATDEVQKFGKMIYENATFFLDRKFDILQKFIKIVDNKKSNKFKQFYDKQLKNIQYGTTYIPIFNNEQLLNINIQKMSETEKEKAIDFIFNFYKSGGFPYPLYSDEELIHNFEKLQQFNVKEIQIDKKILSINNYVGNNIFKHFSPHFWEVKSPYTNQPSMIESFLDDDLLLKVIKNRVEGNYTIHGSMIRQGLRTSNIAFHPSIFHCSIAKYIYEHFTNENDIVYDYSMGFGQRLLGAMSLKYPIKYIGIDPNIRTANANQKMFNFYKEKFKLKSDAEIINNGSENYCPESLLGKINFAFSSPPYYDLEIYDNNENQANHSTYEFFINDWWNRTTSNINNLLTINGKFALNIKEKVNDYKLAEDMISIAEKNGFKILDKFNIKLSKNTEFNRSNAQGIQKLEPIYILEKI